MFYCPFFVMMPCKNVQLTLKHVGQHSEATSWWNVRGRGAEVGSGIWKYCDRAFTKDAFLLLWVCQTLWIIAKNHQQDSQHGHENVFFLFIVFTLHCDASKNNQSRSMMHLCSCNALSSSGEDTPVQTPLIPHEALYPCFICLSFHVQLFIIPQPSDMWSCQQDTININEWFLPALSSRTGVLHLKAFSSLWRLSFRARGTLAFGRPRWSILANNTGDKWVGLYSLYSRLKTASITCKHFGADCCCCKKNQKPQRNCHLLFCNNSQTAWSCWSKTWLKHLKSCR